MSLGTIKKAIADGKMICPTCKSPIRKFDKYVEMLTDVWDGAGDSTVETKGSKVTLVCGNGSCDWSERTQYWTEYIVE